MVVDNIKALYHLKENEDLMVHSCVRTGFDLILQVKNFPPGTEVLMTAVNIPHMAQIVRYHGLIPIPIDIEPNRLAVSLKDVQQKVSPKTKLIVLSYIYGARFDAKDIIEFCN